MDRHRWVRRTGRGDLNVKADLFDLAEEWYPPSSLPDLRNCERIAIDLEICDPNLMTLVQVASQ